MDKGKVNICGSQPSGLTGSQQSATSVLRYEESFDGSELSQIHNLAKTFLLFQQRPERM